MPKSLKEVQRCMTLGWNGNFKNLKTPSEYFGNAWILIFKLGFITKL